MSLLNFRISDVKAVNVDGTLDFTTDWFEFDASMAWSISLTNNVAGGSPTYNIEVTNDKTAIYAYSVASTSALLSVPFQDFSLGFKYIRVRYVAGVATSGTVTPLINIAKSI